MGRSRMGLVVGRGCGPIWVSRGPSWAGLAGGGEAIGGCLAGHTPYWGGGAIRGGCLATPALDQGGRGSGRGRRGCGRLASQPHPQIRPFTGPVGVIGTSLPIVMASGWLVVAAFLYIDKVSQPNILINCWNCRYLSKNLLQLPYYSNL